METRWIQYRNTNNQYKFKIDLIVWKLATESDERNNSPCLKQT